MALTGNDPLKASNGNICRDPFARNSLLEIGSPQKEAVIPPPRQSRGKLAGGEG
jgi:hypothetical protein